MSENKEIQEEATSTEETSSEAATNEAVEGEDSKLYVSHYVGVSTPEDEVHKPAIPLSASELEALRAKGVEEDDLGGDGLLFGLIGLVGIVGVIFVGVAVFFAVNVVSERGLKDADVDALLEQVQSAARTALSTFSEGEDGLYTVPTDVAVSILEANPTLLQQHPSGVAPAPRRASRPSFP